MSTSPTKPKSQKITRRTTIIVTTVPNGAGSLGARYSSTAHTTTAKIMNVIIILFIRLIDNYSSLSGWGSVIPITFSSVTKLELIKFLDK